MGAVRFYSPDELAQKLPQRVLKYSHASAVGGNERVLGVIGSQSITGFSNSLLILEDRLVFMNFSYPLKKIPYTVSFADFDRLKTVPEKAALRLFILTKNAGKLDTGIVAAKEEFDRLSAAVDNQRGEGTKLAETCREQGIDRIHVAAEEKARALREEREKIRNHTDDASLRDAAKIKEMEDKIARNDEKCIEIAKNFLEETRPEFQHDLEEISHQASCIKCRLTYCSGLEAEKPNRKHTIYINHLNQMLSIEASSGQTITIPFSDIRGATVSLEDGTLWNQIPDEKLTVVLDKNLLYLRITCIYCNKPTAITYSNAQKMWDLDNNIFVIEYIFNHLPQLADYYAAARAQANGPEPPAPAPRQAAVPQPAPVAPSAAPQAASPFDEIKKYKELLDQGILTQEEFDAKKKQLLGL